jgi:hypothetical protein
MALSVLNDKWWPGVVLKQDKPDYLFYSNPTCKRHTTRFIRSADAEPGEPASPPLSQVIMVR